MPILLTILTVVPCRSAAGQVVLDRTSEHAIWIEWEKPSFPQSTPFGNGVLFAIYRGRLTPTTFLVVDLPVSNADLVSGGSAKETGVGNPHLGFEYGRAGAGIVHTCPGVVGESDTVGSASGDDEAVENGVGTLAVDALHDV
ncbi:MAG: hypothetical protein O7E49_12785, partial [Gemmatimonadetes bacterium]|nr:hypothetical protein [Gemmatimonadota bacterium]